MHGPEESSPLVWLTVEGESRAVYSSHHYDRQSHSASRSLAMQLSALIAGTLLLCTGYSEAMGRSPRHIPGLAKVMASKAKQGNAVVSSAGFADYADIVESSLKQPLDHFDSSNKVTFRQRYWYSLRHYKPSKGKPTPIFVLDSGETDATGRLPYLDHGILDILAKATGGIGVVLEHRYYGTSFPNRTDLGEGEIWGVDQLRFLNNSQSLQDSARFVQQMRFPEANNSNLRAPHSPVIYYGGSYAGARAAHMRVLYPDLIYGGIASSGVVAAIEDFPDYYYPISRGAQQDCTQAIQSSITWIDSILAPEPWKGHHQPKRDASKAKQLMDIFGLGDLENPADFANVIGVPLGEFQGLNWDPSVSSNGFADFCTALVGEASGPVSPAPQRRSLYNSQVRFVQHNSSADLDVPRVVRNYAKYVKDNFALPCTNQGGTVEECFGTSDWSFYSNSTELNSAISWLFQVCSTWGYFQTAPPFPVKTPESPYTFKPSGPKLISSLIDLEYASEVCRKGYPAGKHYALPSHPDVEEVNKIGGFAIDEDRLAIINGQYDPWRPATAASEEYAYGGARVDTLSRPFKVIANCWHHCDENGNRTFEPPRIAQIHQEMIDFVEAWLGEWKKS